MSIAAQRLKDHVIVVTGAAAGIGQAIVLRCIEEGADLVAVDRDAPGLAATAERAIALGGRCATVCGDIAAADTVIRMLETAQETFGSLDGLVNNAGIPGSIERLENPGEEDFERIVGINLRPVWRALQRGRAPLKASGRGAVVNIASMAALRSSPGLALYAMTKGAVANLTINAAREFARDPVRVNAVCPGPIDTAMLGLMEEHLHERHSPQSQQAIAATIPMHRYGTVQEVAAAASFLLSADASFITGVLLPVDGGTSTI
jgi:NAD(P)-dependent dehydrogenase (short-subunit alcohol dehydrogenase family)